MEATISRREAGVTALFGPSGAGKTSVVNMIAGLSRPDEGRVRVNGSVLFDSRQRINLPPERRRIGYVFQDGRLLPHLSVRANLTYGMCRTPRGKRYLTMDQVVALLTSPALLLMDEPLASLDKGRKAEVLPFIQRLSRTLSIPIFYVSHASDEILALADHVVVLDQGQVVAEGEPSRLMAGGLDPPENRSGAAH